MTALEVGLRGPVTPAAVLAYSGALLSPQTLSAGLRRPPPPVLLVHGEQDGVVPAWATRFADSALQEAGVPTETLLLPGLDHGIDERGIAAGARMLARAFGLSPH
jgi:phospholipase/carboxylesterase